MGAIRTRKKPWYELTPREREVLAELVQGKGNRQIAEALTISEATVENHLHHVFRKLGVASRGAAIVYVLTTPVDLGLGKNHAMLKDSNQGSDRA